MSVDPAGNFVVAWLGSGVHAQRYAAGGGALGTNFLVARTGALDTPDVASDGSGNFVVAYPDSSSQIRARLYEGP